MLLQLQKLTTVIADDDSVDAAVDADVTGVVLDDDDILKSRSVWYHVDTAGLWTMFVLVFHPPTVDPTQIRGAQNKIGNEMGGKRRWKRTYFPPFFDSGPT